MEMEDTIKNLLIERLFLELNPDQIKNDAPLSTYSIDSFLLLELVVALEETFQVTFEQDDITADALRTVDSLAALVRSHQK